MTLLNVNQHQIILVKVNNAATAAPTVTDDTNAGYEIFSSWIDITGDEIYFCTDPAAGAAVWRRAVGSTSGEIIHTVETGIVASVTQTQAGATALTGERVEVVTVANTNDAVRIPSASAGRDCLVFNSGSNVLQVFPAASDSIDDLAVNLSVTITPNTSTLFSAVSGASWYTTSGLVDTLGIRLATTPISIVHIKEKDLGVTAAMLSQAPHGYLTVEDEDARLGLFSEDEGGHGSTVSLAEVNAGVYQDQWAVGRLSSGSSSTFYIEYGTNTQYGTNTNILTMTTGGVVTFPVSPLLHVNALDTVIGVIRVEGGKNTVTGVGEINSALEFGSNDGSVDSTDNVGGKIVSVTEVSNGSSTGLAFYTFQQSRSPDLKEAVHITNAGDVGIGIIIPTAKLHVEEGDAAVINTGGATLVIGGVNSTDSPKLHFKETTDGWNIRHDGSTNSLQFSNLDGGTDRVTFGQNGENGFGVPTPLEILHVDDAIAISSDAEGSTARLTRRTRHETHTLAAAPTSDTTTISIPSGARLLAVSFTVNATVVDSAGDDTWSAAFVTGSTTTLATAISPVINTKRNLMLPDEISTGVCEIRFTANGGNFSAGVIEIVAYYEQLTSLANV